MSCRLLIVTFCLVFASLPGAAQERSADALLAHARQLYAEQGPQAALPEFERALELYRQSGDRKGEAIVLGYIGNAHKRLGDPAQARQFLERALAMKRELGERLEEGKTLSHLGLLFWELGDYASAIEQLTASIAIGRELGNGALEAAALNNLSLVYDEQGNYRQSLQQYERALELHRETGFAEGEAATLGNIGGVHLLLGRYREALPYYEQALAISERMNLKPSASQDLGNLALVYAGMGAFDRALQSFDRALALAVEAGLKKEAADWKKGKAAVLARMGKYTKALEQYEAALGAYEEAGLKRELIEALNERGKQHLLLGDPGSAERDFRRALDLAREIGHARGVIFNLVALAEIEGARKRYSHAAALLEEALGHARKAGDRSHVAAALAQFALIDLERERFDEAAKAAREILEITRTSGERVMTAQAWWLLGESLRRRGEPLKALEPYADAERIALELPDVELNWRAAYSAGQALELSGRHNEAVDAYRRSIRVIEEVRSQLREPRYRSGYLEQRYEVYVRLVQLLLRLERAGEAFQVSEKLRALSYLDLLNRGQPATDGLRDRQEEAALRERIRQLQRAIEQEQSRTAEERRSGVLSSFSAELMQAQRGYQELLDDLRRADPGYAAARLLTVPTLKEVQMALPAGTAILEYIVAEDGVSIFLLTREGLRTAAAAVTRRNVEARVALLRDLLQQPRSADWVKPAQALWDVLIGPVARPGWLEQIERVYVVPHGTLHYLPFALLPRADGERLRYFGDEHTLAYLPAASALVHRRAPTEAASGLFALAPAKSRLRYAQPEAHEIARFFPQNSLVLAGSTATESAFKRRAEGYRVIHFATHGYFNRTAPLLSGVELEPGENEDGRLEVHEILGLRLNADLVTLSACETALGSGYFSEVPAGDDFVGLTRAFLFVGSPSVLASLWEVNDRSTLQQMRSFYGSLAGAGKAAALAQAQRELRSRGGRYAHPYYWAPFVLVGAMD